MYPAIKMLMPRHALVLAAFVLVACNADGLITTPPPDMVLVFGDDSDLGSDAAAVDDGGGGEIDLAFPTCFDNTRDQDETDVDCGGTHCPACDVGKACALARDCRTRSCEGAQCVPRPLQFLAAQDFPTGPVPGSLATADLDGDGAQDLVVSTPGTNPFQDRAGHLFSFLHSLGNGRFAPPTFTDNPGNRSCQIAIGDFDGDPLPDVAVVQCAEYSNMSDFVTLFANQGKGAFKLSDGHAVGRGTVGLVAADVTGDGKVDVVTAGGVSNDVSLLIGKGKGTMKDAVNAPTVNQAGALESGDFDGDGISDVVVGGPVGLQVLAGGAAALVPGLTVAGKFNGVGVRDFDGDGKLDVVTANGVPPLGGLYRGDGMGKLVLAGTFGGQFAGNAVAVADFDGDLHPDAALLGQSITVFANRGGALTPLKDYQASYPRLLAGDWNGDGKPDLAALDNYGEYVRVYLGTGDGGLVHAEHYGTIGGECASGDFNGDGRADVAALDYNNRTVLVMLGVGKGALGPATTVQTAGSAPDDIAAADLNKDGVVDLVLANQTNNSGTFAVLLGVGDGTFGKAVEWPVNFYAFVMAVDDFDHDGALDLATFDEGRIDVLRGRGDGTFLPVQETLTKKCSGRRRLATGDFNSDHSVDVVESCESGTIVLFGNGDGTFGEESQVFAGWSSAAAVCDLDGDGHLDIVVAGHAIGGQRIDVLYGSGAGKFAPPVESLIPGKQDPNADPAYIACADFDKDGRPDVALAGLGDVIVFANQGQRKLALAGAFGGTPQSRGSMTLADFDGDQRTDIAQSGRGVTMFLNRSQP